MLGIFLFVLGLMIGGVVGVFAMCLAQINKAVKKS